MKSTAYQAKKNPPGGRVKKYASIAKGEIYLHEESLDVLPLFALSGVYQAVIDCPLNQSDI